MFQDVLRVVQAYAGKAVRWPAATEITPEQETAARTVIRSLVQGAKTERPKHLARPKQRVGGVRPPTDSAPPRLWRVWVSLAIWAASNNFHFRWRQEQFV